MSIKNYENNQQSHYDDSELPLLVTFPDVIDGKINTEQFLNSSRATFKIIDRLGKVFTAVKYDMQNNIEKLTAKLKADEIKHETLQDIILSEKESGNKNKIAIESLLWLARELRMIQLFFARVVEAHQMGCPSEELFPTLKDAYKESLEPHHGFMATQLFNLLAKNVFTRSELFLHLANGVRGQEETTLLLMEIFADGLRKNLLNLHRFMESHELGSILNWH